MSWNRASFHLCKSHHSNQFKLQQVDTGPGDVLPYHLQGNGFLPTANILVVVRIIGSYYRNLSKLAILQLGCQKKGQVCKCTKKAEILYFIKEVIKAVVFEAKSTLASLVQSLVCSTLI